MRSARSLLTWAMLALAVGVPLTAAALSPLLAYRNALHIAGGFAGIIALGLLLAQPLLIAGLLPGLTAIGARRVHRYIGGAILVAVLVHVGALWIVSPSEITDALLLISPTPFSPWGVIAMWALLATALLAALRHRLRVRPRTWRLAHAVFAIVIVICTVVHAVLIEGAMETISKAVLCALVLVATIKIIADLRTSSKSTALRTE